MNQIIIPGYSHVDTFLQLDEIWCDIFAYYTHNHDYLKKEKDKEQRKNIYQIVLFLRATSGIIFTVSGFAVYASVQRNEEENGNLSETYLVVIYSALAFWVIQIPIITFDPEFKKISKKWTACHKFVTMIAMW